MREIDPADLALFDEWYDAFRAGAVAGREAALLHLLQLLPRRHLLREQRRLDAVEQTFEPADERRLRDAQLGLRRGRLAERERQLRQLLLQVGRQALSELVHRHLVDLAQARPALVVERSLSDLVEQLPDHRADAHDLRGLLDRLGSARRAVVRLLHDFDGWCFRLLRGVFVHGVSRSSRCGVRATARASPPRRPSW